MSNQIVTGKTQIKMEGTWKDRTYLIDGMNLSEREFACNLKGTYTPGKGRKRWYVRLIDLKEVHTHAQLNGLLVSYVPIYITMDSHDVDSIWSHTTQANGRMVEFVRGERRIGCAAFGAREWRKIMRAAGVQL